MPRAKAIFFTSSAEHDLFHLRALCFSEDVSNYYRFLLYCLCGQLCLIITDVSKGSIEHVKLGESKCLFYLRSLTCRRSTSPGLYPRLEVAENVEEQETTQWFLF